MMRIGVLALQGDFASHAKILQREPQVEVVAARDAAALKDCDGLIIPGGESTTMSRLCDRYDLWQPLREIIQNGLPTLGTCAGLIMLAKNISGASPNFAQKTLGLLDVDVARNAYGPQIESFETTLEVPVLQNDKSNEPTLRAAFIRAPRITRVGAGVEVIARHDDEPVAVRQKRIIAVAFHPEVVGETRLHQWWLREIVNPAIVNPK